MNETVSIGLLFELVIGSSLGLGSISESCLPELELGISNLPEVLVADVAYAGIEVAYKCAEGDGGVGFRCGAGWRIICGAFGD